MSFPERLISLARSKKRSSNFDERTVAISSLSIVTTIDCLLSTRIRPFTSRILPLGALSIISSVVLS